MQKIIAIMLLLCSVFFAGCTQNNVKTEAPKPATPVVQQPRQVEVVVYRAAGDGSERLLPEKLTVADNGKSLPETALIALCSTKPGKSDYADVVPNGTKVLGLKVENGLATADFSKELAKKGQGAYQEMMLVYAIVNTLTEYPEIQKVQILVEGKKRIVLSSQMDIEDPIKRNKTLLPENNASKAK